MGWFQNKTFAKVGCKISRENALGKVNEWNSWGHHIVFGQVHVYYPSVAGDQQNVLSFIGRSPWNGFSSKNMTANHQTLKAHQPHYWYQLQEELCDNSYLRALALKTGYSEQNTGKEAVWTYSRCSFLHISTSLLVHSGVVWIVTPCDPRCVTGFWGCMLWMPTRKHHYTVLLVRVPVQLSRSGGICFPLRVEMDCNDVGIICASWTEVFKVFIELNHNPSCFLYGVYT